MPHVADLFIWLKYGTRRTSLIEWRVLVSLKLVKLTHTSQRHHSQATVMICIRAVVDKCSLCVLTSGGWNHERIEMLCSSQIVLTVIFSVTFKHICSADSPDIRTERIIMSVVTSIWRTLITVTSIYHPLNWIMYVHGSLSMTAISSYMRRVSQNREAHTAQMHNESASNAEHIDPIS